MTLKEFKKKVLTMIEEYVETSETYTSDQDIELKLNSTINQIMFELARIKKMPEYVGIEVQEGDLIRFDDIAEASGFEVYQLDRVQGAMFEYKAGGTIIKALEDGMLDIDFFKYPEQITDKTSDSYEFELSADVLEIMAYGVAGDLLKTDVSTEYGAIFSNRYEQMIARLDPRFAMKMFSVEGGVSI